MEFLPLHFDLKGRRCLVVGDQDIATRKADLLRRAGAELLLNTLKPCDSLRELSLDRAVRLVDEPFHEDLLNDVELVVAASDDPVLNRRVSEAARKRHLPVNVVEQPDLSTFIFPSIIDRSPIIVSVSSGSQIPVLTRLLRSRLESLIPHAYGRLASVAAEFRERVREQLPHQNQRRRFWESVLEGKIADLVLGGREDKARQEIEAVLAESEHFTQLGEVYLVGAGPGDPDLLTFKALRLMRQADVVLYDRLVAPEILDLVRRDAERINVGKERSRHTLPQEDINQLLVSLAKQGKRVLRLKGGDPFIFGRGGEEIERLSEAGIPFQVVPGISAANGCAAYAGIPLTHRDYSQSVRFITGHLKDNSIALPWQEFVQEHQTLVFYMGLQGLPEICRQLIAHGMRPDMPVALVSRGTTRFQKVLTSTLQEMPSALQREEIQAPTLIIIGEVVKLREKLAWLD